MTDTPAEALKAGDDRLAWHTGDNIRWLADQSSLPERVPCGLLTSKFLQQVADSCDRMAAREKSPPTPDAGEVQAVSGREQWQPIGTAPSACHVIGARFDQTHGEWIYAVVKSPPSKPFTHWRPLPAPPKSP